MIIGGGAAANVAFHTTFSGLSLRSLPGAFLSHRARITGGVMRTPAEPVIGDAHERHQNYAFRYEETCEFMGDG